MASATAGRPAEMNLCSSGPGRSSTAPSAGTAACSHAAAEHPHSTTSPCMALDEGTINASPLRPKGNWDSSQIAMRSPTIGKQHGSRQSARCGTCHALPHNCGGAQRRPNLHHPLTRAWFPETFRSDMSRSNWNVGNQMLSNCWNPYTPVLSRIPCSSGPGPSAARIWIPGIMPTCNVREGGWNRNLLMTTKNNLLNIFVVLILRRHGGHVRAVPSAVSSPRPAPSDSMIAIISQPLPMG